MQSRFTRTVAVAAAMSALALGAAACGSDDDNSSSAGASGGTSTSSTFGGSSPMSRRSGMSGRQTTTVAFDWRRGWITTASVSRAPEAYGPDRPGESGHDDEQPRTHPGGMERQAGRPRSPHRVVLRLLAATGPALGARRRGAHLLVQRPARAHPHAAPALDPRGRLRPGARLALARCRRRAGRVGALEHGSGGDLHGSRGAGSTSRRRSPA